MCEIVKFVMIQPVNQRGYVSTERNMLVEDQAGGGSVQFMENIHLNALE